MKLVIVTICLNISFAVFATTTADEPNKEKAQTLVEIMVASPSVTLHGEELNLELRQAKQAAVDSTAKMMHEPSPDAQQIMYYATQYHKALEALQKKDAVLQATLRENNRLKAQTTSQQPTSS
jgi:hypothetical protein